MKNLILVLFAISFSAIFGQNKKIVATKINSITVDADEFIGTDSFGFSYSVKNNVFSKTEAEKSFEYKNISLGKITRVDLQNPMQIVLFYENFNTVVMLDNQLNETQKLNFSENNIPINAIATGIASKNRLWIYNSLSQQIGLYDYLKNTFQSITPSFQGTLKHYESDFNTFYWIDEKNNLYSCSIFGKSTLLGKIPDFDQIQVVSNSVMIYKKNNALYYYTLNDDKATLIDFDKKSFDNFYYKDQILAIFTSKQITNYKIILP